jgi:selenocysteine lyase/cysteine desulfurase
MRSGPLLRILLIIPASGGGRMMFALLLAYPAQSNFSGVQHPLDWIQTAHEHAYDVLLHAAAYVPSNRLDLSVVKPDFVAVSWYKVFGYPTGVGCLIARREALGRLRRPWFAGGSVHIAGVQAGWHAMAADKARSRTARSASCRSSIWRPGCPGSTASGWT